MQRTFVLGPYSLPSLALTGLTRVGLRVANALELGNDCVERLPDLRWGDGPGDRLDVYRAAARRAADAAPLVVFLHGGTWTYFCKDDFRFVGAALAGCDAVAVVPNYRRHPHTNLDGQLLDAARVVAWARRHAGEFGADPARLVLVGHSSGAHLAALLALDPHRLARVGGSPRWLAGFVGLAGPYWFAPTANAQMAEFFGPAHRYPDAQAVRFAGRDAPPALLVHGLRDRLVRPQNSRELARRLRECGARVELELVPGDGHGTVLERWLRPRRAADPLLARIDRFVRGRHDRAGAVPDRAPPRPAVADAVAPRPRAHRPRSPRFGHAARRLR